MDTDFCGTFYAAKMLGLSVGTVQALVEKGEVEAWKTKGGHRRISLQSLHDYQVRSGLNSPLDTSTPYLKVLFVDDNELSLTAIRLAVDRMKLPLDVILMTSAMEALIDISNLQPHVLFTDLRMPGVDGFDFLRTIRSNASFASMVLVAVTGLTITEIAARGGLPPHTVYVEKPLDMNWLNGFLSALVADRQLKHVPEGSVSAQKLQELPPESKSNLQATSISRLSSPLKEAKTGRAGSTSK
jgi:excisionase family DNA binding protein